MAFPVVQQTRGNSLGTSSVNRTVTMPATVNAGDLLIFVITTSNSTAATFGTPSGWTKLGESTGTVNTAVYYKVADGTEDGATVTVVMGAAVTNSAHIVYRITGYDSTALCEVAFGAATSAQPDPPSLTPSWGAQDTLWIAGFGKRSTAMTVTTYPTNYSSNPIDDGGATTCRTVAATRNLNAASEDPGAYDITNTANILPFTIAVAPVITRSLSLTPRHTLPQSHVAR